MDAPLRIALFGALTVQIGDRTLPDSVWRSRQEQRLLAILAATRGRVIAAGRLCEWLWPDSDSASASVNLRSAISNLRRVLEPEADRASRRYILTRSGGYAWNRESGAWIDVDEFLTLTESLAGGQTTGSMEQGEADLERAITLYRGDFLEDEQELAWAAMERERLRARYLDALRRVAEIKLDRGDPMAAAALASRGIAIAPLAEPLWRILMLAQARSGDTAGALQSYERYRHLLDHELGAAPSPQTQALHMAILRGDPGSYAPAAVSSSHENRHDRQRIEPRSPRAGQRSPGSAATPIVGRQEELALLHRWLADLDRRSGGIVTIVGEAGIGKTRLIGETLRTAAERCAFALELRATPLDQGLPFAAVGEMLRPLLRNVPEYRLRQLPQFALAQIADLFPVLRERLPDLPELPDVPPEERRNRQIDGLCELALALARTLPLVVALDDAQWADDATLATVGRLARQASRRALLLILAYRADELSDNPALHNLLRTLGRDMILRPLVLGRLDASAVAELLAGLAGVEIGRVAHLAPQLVASTGGNPLALMVTVQALLESRGAPSLAALLPDLEAGMPFPDPTEAPQMRELVRARIDRLPPHARDLAEHLALISRPASLDLIERLGGADALEAAQILLERQILIENDDTHLAFNHDLVRSIIAATLSAPQRRRLHHRIGAAMAALEGHRPERAAEITYHFCQAGRSADRDVLRYAIDAGDYARRAFGYRHALHHYDAAIEAGERLGAEAPVEMMQRAFAGRLLTCETLLDWNGLEETSARYERWATQRSVTPSTLVAPRRLVLLRALMGDLAGAAAISAAHAARGQTSDRAPSITDMLRRTALILQPDAYPEGIRRSHASRRDRQEEGGDPRHGQTVSRETGDRRNRRTDPLPADNAHTMWQAWPSFRIADPVPGNPAEELPKLLGPDEAAAALFQIGWAALMQGLLRDARPCLTQSYTLAVETGQAPAAVVSALQLAHLNALAGKPDETTIWLERSLETAARASEAAWASIWPRIHQGFLWLIDDRLALAEQRFVEMAARLAGVAAFQSHRASVVVGMGMVALARGDLTGADAYFHEALRAPHQLYGFIYVSAHLGIARLAALRNDLPGARTMLLHTLHYTVQRALLPEYVRTVIEVARIERDFGDPAPVLAHLRSAARLARSAGLAPLAAAASALSTRLEESHRVP
ncbi:MAG: AAA family ATPase [Roseiflexus sp.]|uniref:BTAD domain-containing putative transcriptional regulator n=1 Tax=Roseiflexus sp. TaxID=2562120 RepID=UPI0025EBA92A|nr:BTAD domain-containing putative transcriptional regulator [Roseiflexus sp.]MCL6539585.1 AAA family ATPase [Roseiflexus sp.]